MREMIVSSNSPSRGKSTPSLHSLAELTPYHFLFDQSYPVTSSPIGSISVSSTQIETRICYRTVTAQVGRPKIVKCETYFALDQDDASRFTRYASRFSVFSLTP
jgi:hypothetical protein